VTALVDVPAPLLRRRGIRRLAPVGDGCPELPGREHPGGVHEHRLCLREGLRGRLAGTNHIPTASEESSPSPIARLVTGMERSALASFTCGEARENPTLDLAVSHDTTER
jgi:hypothetical protein